MINCQFIFRPGLYDEDFHALDSQIDAFARSLAGFRGVETWRSEDGTVTNASYYFDDMAAVRELAQLAQHRAAKAEYARWYEGYQIIVGEIVSVYGDGRLEHITREDG